MADAADSKSADRKVVKVRLLSPTESLIKNTGNSKEFSFYWGFGNSICLQLCQPVPANDSFGPYGQQLVTIEKPDTAAKCDILFNQFAGLAELADAPDSKSGGRKAV